eukprot:GGOE01049627.1.p2 GENE.GGOE01049627.1~~GGOE01049627.1.p2  ORF type:complete len:424 (-),score=142.65 GGOE01049627.1:258-1490(-)
MAQPGSSGDVAQQVAEVCAARKLQKTAAGPRVVIKHRVLDGKAEQQLLKQAELVRGPSSLTRASQDPDARFRQAYNTVLATLKAHRGVKMAAEDILRETKGNAALDSVDHLYRNGVDIRVEKEYVGKDGRPPRTMEQVLIDMFERQSVDAASAEREQSERLMYEEGSRTFCWRGLYSNIRSRENILSSLEEIDAMAHEGEAACIGIETQQLQGCYPGCQQDVLDLIASNQVYCLIRRQRKAMEVTVADLQGLTEETRPEERQRVEADVLENAVIYWKCPATAAVVEGLDPSLKALWRAVGEECNQRQDLLDKFRKAPKLQSRLIPTVEDPAQQARAVARAEKGRREGRDRTRILNDHMPKFDFSKPFDKAAYEARLVQRPKPRSPVTPNAAPRTATGRTPSPQPAAKAPT